MKKAMDYNMDILTLPPHTSHELQPLDVTCYGPMKRGTQTHEMIWYRQNPGKRITIHHLTAITREPFLNAMTPSNIISGFKKSCIHPFKWLEEGDICFSAAKVTDLPGKDKVASNSIFNQ